VSGRGLVLVLCLSACGSAGGTAAGTTQTSTTGDAQGRDQAPMNDGPVLAVGAACTENDGWLPPVFLCPDAGADAPGPVNCAPPRDAGYIDRNQLPPGVGFCLTGPFYPHGYFTTNCARADDCPAGTVCDDGKQCRKPCQADTECQAPATCLVSPPGASPTAVRYCACLPCDRTPPP